MSPASACLCVLCGLPAAGKSRLVQELRGHAHGRGWRTLIVTYDELIPARYWREAEWKQQRKTLLMCLERFLRQTHTHSHQTHTHSEQTHAHSDQADAGAWMRFERMLQHQSVPGTHLQPLVLLLDDNFYYQSMRLQVQQLARKYALGFCQVFLHCPLHVCLQRNQQRSQAVPDDVLLQISERMEPPNPSRNPWEQQSLTLDGSGPIVDGDVQKLMLLLASALENPLSPIRDESQQKEADRQTCASSVLHRADQMCRRLVSQAMASARGTQITQITHTTADETRVVLLEDWSHTEQQASPEELKALAKDLNELKSAVLQDLKKEVLHQASALPEEPIDTQQLLEEACAAFEQRTRHTVTEHTWNSTESS